jgi:hypothetical protein
VNFELNFGILAVQALISILLLLCIFLTLLSPLSYLSEPLLFNNKVAILALVVRERLSLCVVLLLFSLPLPSCSLRALSLGCWLICIPELTVSTEVWLLKDLVQYLGRLLFAVFGVRGALVRCLTIIHQTEVVPSSLATLL